MQKREELYLELGKGLIYLGLQSVLFFPFLFLQTYGKLITTKKVPLIAMFLATVLAFVWKGFVCCISFLIMDGCPLSSLRFH
jgi:hypothetical protein